MVPDERCQRPGDTQPVDTEGCIVRSDDPCICIVDHDCGNENMVRGGWGGVGECGGRVVGL